MPTIAITSEAPSLDSPVDPRFGRAAGFLIVNADTMEFKYVENGKAQTMSQGAGIQAAENVAQSGATVILTGYVGPKAFQALSAVGIQVGQNLDNMTVRQAIERYTSGKIDFAAQPNRQGHPS